MQLLNEAETDIHLGSGLLYIEWQTAVANSDLKQRGVIFLFPYIKWIFLPYAAKIDKLA